MTLLSHARSRTEGSAMLRIGRLGSVVDTARSFWIAGDVGYGSVRLITEARVAPDGVRSVATDLLTLRGDFADRVVDEPREVGAGCFQRFSVSPCSAQHEGAFDGGDEEECKVVGCLARYS